MYVNEIDESTGCGREENGRPHSTAPRSSHEFPSVTLLGVRIHNVTRADVLREMESLISHRRRAIICTPNADHIVLCMRDAEFREIIESADLVVADGMAVIYASRILGTPLEENVGGRRLVPAFAELAAHKGYRIFLMGAGRGVARKAADNLTMWYPGLNIAGVLSPPYRDEFSEPENRWLVEQINKANPDVLFVGMGTPKQEKWLARNLWCLRVPVSIGVGAALDIIAGKTIEPPIWVTSVGLEWLFRLIQEPRRLWYRYLIRGPWFFYLVVRERLRGLHL